MFHRQFQPKRQNWILLYCIEYLYNIRELTNNVELLGLTSAPRLYQQSKLCFTVIVKLSNLGEGTFRLGYYETQGTVKVHTSLFHLNVL